MKEYRIRVYIEDERVGEYVNYAVEIGAVRLINSFDGIGGCLAIYDVSCEGWVIEAFIEWGVRVFPLDNYGDFDIRLNGVPIEDNMILKVYDEHVLSGFNVFDGNLYGKAEVTYIKY